MLEENKYRPVSLALLILLITAVLFVQMDISTVIGSGNSLENPSAESENLSYAEPGENAGKLEQTQSADTVVTIEALGVAPARPKLNLGEPVEFRNKNPYPVRLEFDRTEEEPVITPNSSAVMSFTAMTSYDVINIETEERVTGGQINAQ